MAAEKKEKKEYKKLTRRQVLRMCITPAAIAVCIVVYCILPNVYPDGYEAHTYIRFLVGSLVVTIALLLVSCAWYGLRKRWANIAPLIAAVFGIFEVLDLLTLKSGILEQPLLQSPDRILAYLVDDIAALFSYTGSSLSILLVGILVGFVLGMACGILAGYAKVANYWIMPLLKIIGPVPSFIWMPIAIYLCPNSYIADVALVALAVWFPLTLMLSVAMRQVDKVYVERARILGASNAHIVFRVLLPAAMPAIFDGLFMGFSSAFAALSVAEMMGVSQGLAVYLRIVTRMGKYANAYATTFFLMVIFFVLIFTLLAVRRHMLVWKEGLIREELRR